MTGEDGWAEYMGWEPDADPFLTLLRDELRWRLGYGARVEWRRAGAGDLVVRRAGSAVEVRVSLRGTGPDAAVAYRCGGRSFPDPARQPDAPPARMTPFGLADRWLDLMAAEGGVA